MRPFERAQGLRGMTLIDVMVGTAIMLVVFLSIFGAFKISIDLIYSTKAKTGAVSLIADRLEYIRSLPYDSVGTSGGIPSGTLAQVSTSTINAIPYTIQTLVQYVDDPADGTGNSDANSITADYKIVRVEADWNIRGSSRSSYAVTTIAPTGLETLANGGTLTVNVLNALAAPVADAVVTITNASTSPAINISAGTSDAGSVSFPGAPVAGGYHVVVTEPGYSTAQTYTATGANPNPSPADVAVINHKTSTISLSIDLLGKLHAYTYAPPATAVFSDTFSDQSKLIATTSTTVAGGALVLASPIAGMVGSASSTITTSAYLSQWGTFAATTSVPAGTTLLFHIFGTYNGGPYTMIPDSTLPGNSVGFASTSVSLAGIPIGSYNGLGLVASFTTSSSTTASLQDWSLSYALGPTPLPNIGMSLRGAKTIGTTATSAPIYKYSSGFTTNASGEYIVDPLEWDSYTAAPTGAYDVIERCPDSLSVSPGATLNAAFTLVAHTTNSLKVYVTGSGTALAGATVALGRAGATTTMTSSACGQTFFPSLSASTYTLMVSGSGFQTSTQQVTISGTSAVSVPLAP